MAVNGPSSWALTQAMGTLSAARERLREIDPGLEDDWQLYQDCLDGESGDAMQIIERVIEASIEADSMADATKLRKMDIAERQARFEKRRDTLRTVALSALEALNMRKMERPAWTASLRANQPPLIVDETALPEQWFRTKREPLRAEIRKELANGTEIEGAVLGNASTGISIRTR
jgi:Siphovirus Gp157